jgi:hypothetical protein
MRRPKIDDELRIVEQSANRSAEKSSAMCRHMILDTRVQGERAWTWQPGKSLRASESTAPVSDGERVHRTLKRVAKARALLDSNEAAALREAQRIRLWEQFGYTSLVDYMERELGYTARAAMDRLRVANAIEELPQVEAALEQGTLSFSGARALAPVLKPETQAAWLEKTRDMNVRQIEELVSGHKRGDLPSDPIDEQLRTKVLRFEVKLDVAALVRDYQKKRARQLGKIIDDDLLLREVFQLALDRLVDQRRRPEADAEDSAREVAVAESKAASPVAVAPPRHQVAVTACECGHRGWLNAAGTKTLLAPAELAAIACDNENIGRVDLPGKPRKRSSIPPAIRRKVMARDGHRCRVPGCRSTNIDAHHIKAWALGGTHDEHNLLTLCEAHHLAIHRGTLVMRGTAPSFTFDFVAANRFTRETRIVETRRALEQRGLTKQEARAVVDAVRTHVGEEPLSADGWLILALSMGACAS